MRKIMIVVLLVRQLQHGFTKNAKVSPNLTVAHIVRCLSVLNVHFCKKSQTLAQMTFHRYLSNPDIGRTFWDGITHSN